MTPSLAIPSPVSAPAPTSSRTVSSFAPARLRRTLRLAIKSLWLHRLRSLLTVLGIVFGVCSVIAMLAIGEGASFEAQELIRSEEHTSELQSRLHLVCRL